MANYNRRNSDRRRTIWARYSLTATTDANGFYSWDPLIDFDQLIGAVVSTPALLGATVTRIRGTITANDASLWGIGILAFRVTDDVITNVDAPALQANREDDWLGWVNFGYDIPTRPAVFTDFDIKGQRRMDELGMHLVGMVDLGPVAGANQFACVTSVLLTLP